MALLFWAVGVLAYLVAVFHRQSLSVAGLDAAERMGVSEAGMATLAMLQLLVYALMQVPVGVLLDRFGSKRLLLTGALTMAAGQLVFALSDNLLYGIAARMLIGLGDAMTFISVVRLVNLAFPPHRNPLLLQLTGLIGQLGAIASTVPMIASLHTYGWAPTFYGAAGVGVVMAVLLIAVLRDKPSGQAAEPGLKAAWTHPGTRLGMWTHVATQCSAAAFLLLWGYPFLVEGQGLAPQTAGVLLATLTAVGMVCGPVLGYLAGRYPLRRSWLVLGVIGSTAAAWTAVLAWPGHAPLWLLVVLVVVLAANGPGSMIGFDYARTFNPAGRIGAATGIVNGGGFLASMSVIALIAIGLEVFDDYRLAFLLQYPVWLLGVVQVLRYRAKARRLLAQLDEGLGEVRGAQEPALGTKALD
ncbi:MFS transporter [Nonomuraea soli]|uniref:MFS family permease n=1 Tax=Nonomuraea soli TaxID=1032476 RepID=A0A7W0CHY9_9ACTN|nr:MFS transporter [Nonomuraea soli]MBA2891499.1 MFS family permease [Nonomuraea soli]